MASEGERTERVKREGPGSVSERLPQVSSCDVVTRGGEGGGWVLEIPNN